MTIEDLLTISDAAELEWEGGKGWRNAFGRRTHQNDGHCEIDDVCLCFQRQPRTMQDEPFKYVCHIEKIVDVDKIDVIVGPAFASSENEAKDKLLVAVKRLLSGPQLTVA